MSKLEEYINLNKDKIAAIKLAVSSLNNENISLKRTLIRAISWEYKFYLQTQDIEYLYTSILIIEAYLELGFPYKYGQKYFDQIFTAFNESKEPLFLQTKFAKTIKLNKSQLSCILSRWGRSADNCKNKPEVIKEIIYNVTYKKQGVYTYQTRKGHVYELVISDVECYLYDYDKSICYSFIEDNHSNFKE